ncbi:hypothetical protein [Bradyrhizobium sp. McL0616]|uniref:hypothetical protein n=1 Tax=Bradyrhizobium sp. McL0616 TaxID=3415674 RepID=UPI003CEBA16D
MLGPVGRFGSNYLRSKGFIIERPTEIERTFERSFWKELFSSDIDTFAAVYAQNRKTLAKVPKWISEETIACSLWSYGVHDIWHDSQDALNRTGIDDLETEITAADVLGFVARKLSPGVSYLEIGVSVGKNILQLEHQISNSALVGLDIEEVNPTLAAQFHEPTDVMKPSLPYWVDTFAGKKAEKRTTFKRMTSERSNIFEYLSADEFRKSTWQTLKGRKFNLVFSDGVHTGEALRTEFDYLKENDLIARDRFVMFWDDLNHPEMQAAFVHNCRELCKIFGKDDRAIFLFKLHGSYGAQRPMGMFSSLS